MSNNKYERCGSLFQGRYRSEVVEDEEYLLTVLRYIHHNPLKAGIVNDLNNFKWSSYGEYTGKNRNRIIDTNFILNILSNNRRKAISAFQEFHKKDSDTKCIDIDDNIKLTDNEAAVIIKKLCNINSCKELQKINRSERNKRLNQLRKNGISKRQIERLTGLSRHQL